MEWRPSVAVRRAPRRPRPATLSAADRDAIVGNYALQLPGGGASDEDLPRRLAPDGAGARVRAANELQYLGNYAFGIAADPAIRLTFTLVAGKATKLTVLQNGATMDAPRVP